MRSRELIWFAPVRVAGVPRLVYLAAMEMLRPTGSAGRATTGRARTWSAACAGCGGGVLWLACMVSSLLFGASVGAADTAGESWWDEHWECRLRVQLPVAPVRVRLPVTIRGAALRRAGVEGRIPTGSFRVVGPRGELACQVDESDGTGEWLACGNRVLDDDDELVFLADLVDDGPSLCFVYFSRHPRPPGRYATALRYSRPSAALNKAPIHGVFYAPGLKLGVKGPKTSEPMAHDLLNYCSGAISAFRWRDYDFVHPVRSWMWFIPRHPFGAGQAAAEWSLPELVIDGPVRKVVRMEGKGLGERVRTVRHCIAVTADGGVVDFREAVEYAEGAEAVKLTFGFPLAVTEDVRTAYGVAGGMSGRDLTEDERSAQSEGKAVVVHRVDASGDALPWWVWWSPGRKVGLALFLARDDAGTRGGAKREGWSTSTYLRRNQTMTEFTLTPRSQPVVRHAMRFCCLDGPETVPLRFDAWSDSGQWVTLGVVETRAAAAGESGEVR